MTGSFWLFSYISKMGSTEIIVEEIIKKIFCKKTLHYEDWRPT
jgi:hypothetical protein